ncbi:MAG: methyltransferase domain-containing protein [Deltaproteobacteria bacterium]|nr:methyltransferase domain-containing protein [Deltaproteobacteria bacterium]
MDIHSIEKAYQRYANIYDVTFGKIFHRGRVASVDLLNIQPGEKVLEVGVGTGLTLPFFPDNCHVTGIDLSEHMLDKARENIELHGKQNVEIKQMDATHMDFPDNHFDSVVAAYVISVVPDPVKVLNEMMRVCKKGGKIVFINHFKCDNPVIAGLEQLISPLSRYLGFKTDLELEPLLEEIPKLQVEKIEGVNLFNYWKVVEGINNK